MPDDAPFAPDGDGTLLTVVMELAGTADAMLTLGMADGLEMGYARIDAMERKPA